MVQQSPKGTPSRKTPTRGPGPKSSKQAWVNCPQCDFLTMNAHECGVPGPCIGDRLVKLLPVFKDTVYCHLHPDTMKEIGLKIGAFVRMGSEVYECWPDVSVLLNHVGYNSQERTLVTVGVVEEVIPASKIIFTVAGGIDKSYLPFVLQSKVVYSGMAVSVPYFSKKVEITVDSACGVSSADERTSYANGSVDSITEGLSNAVLNDRYYQVTTSTVFVEKQSPIKLPLLIGLDEMLGKVTEVVEQSLKFPESFGDMGPPQTLLLTGPSGSGKTLLCKTLLQDKLEQYQSCCITDFTKPLPQDDVNKLFLLDCLDSIRDDDNERIGNVKTFLQTVPLGSFVVATASHLPSALKKHFPHQLQMPAVTSEIRAKIFETYLANSKAELSATQIQDVSSKAHGYVGADICNVCRQALLLAKDGKLSLQHLLTALTKVPPRAMNDIKIEVPEVRWSDIGGLRGVQELLTKVISWPIIHQEKYRKMGISPPRGVLMYGPPGCCKTMMAKALATESSLNFLSVKGPELLSMYVGESERAIRDLFSRARTAAPAIIFFDEIDALASHRGADKGSGVNDRVIAQLLTELDGVEGLTGVVVIAATNRPDRIDKALLRPGRLEKLVYIPLPDLECRTEIFKLKFSKIPHEELDFEECAKLTEGFSGAEVVAVCHNAAIESIVTDTVTFEMVKDAIYSIPPQISAQSLELYEAFVRNKI